jgi:murein L,D-transpeptidase YcbB/YkuD
LNEAKLDVLLADAMASVADDVHYGHVVPSQVNPEWTADPRDGAPPLDSVLTAIARSGSIPSAIDQLRPNHFIYRGLTQALANLRRIDAAGGWPTVPAGKPLRAGSVDRRVAAVRRRLLASGDLTAAVPRDSTRYDATLAHGVETFQARHRLTASGVTDAATIAAMNVPVRDRIAQVRVNLERARWVLGGLEQDFMLVNLPAFKAYLIRGGRNVWESRTQIGEEAMQTPTFRATIRTVVFNPDWTVPPTILQNEIFEDMRAGKNVIEDKGLVIYDASNHVVDSNAIHWDAVTADDFPYTIKQPPGDENALGKVKFLFPNKYSIYLHDTPNRALFEADRRTFSHGCIRIEHPLDLAVLLLEGQDHWDATKIEQSIASDSTHNVGLEHPLPILIVYWTVSVGAAGEVRYANDIYDLDPPLLAALDRRYRR